VSSSAAGEECYYAWKRTVFKSSLLFGQVNLQRSMPSQNAPISSYSVMIPEEFRRKCPRRRNFFCPHRGWKLPPGRQPATHPPPSAGELLFRGVVSADSILSLAFFQPPPPRDRGGCVQTVLTHSGFNNSLFPTLQLESLSNITAAGARSSAVRTPVCRTGAGYARMNVEY